MSIPPRSAKKRLTDDDVAEMRRIKREALEQMLQTSELSDTSERKKHRYLGRLIDAFAVLVLMGGAIGLYLTYQNNQDIKRQVETVSADDGSNEPNNGDSSSSARPPSVERPPERDVYDYHVAADMPRFIAIDSIDVFARIMHIGRDSNGNVGAPTNIHDTSWYTSSSLPTVEDRGSTVISGHIGRDRYNGVFYDLPLVETNDTVNITMGDGSVVSYRVTEKKTIPVQDMRMGDYLGYQGKDAPQLHLITCVGEYDSELLSYRDRLVVTAERL